MPLVSMLLTLLDVVLLLCRPFLFKEAPSVTVIREPVSRLISAFHYRGHSPNLDFFQVRKEFKMIKDGLMPKVGACL
jgi:hypothetical protein